MLKYFLILCVCLFPPLISALNEDFLLVIIPKSQALIDCDRLSKRNPRLMVTLSQNFADEVDQYTNMRKAKILNCGEDLSVTAIYIFKLVEALQNKIYFFLNSHMAKNSEAVILGKPDYCAWKLRMVNLAKLFLGPSNLWLFIQALATRMFADTLKPEEFLAHLSTIFMDLHNKLWQQLSPALKKYNEVTRFLHQEYSPRGLSAFYILYKHVPSHFPSNFDSILILYFIDCGIIIQDALKKLSKTQIKLEQSLCVKLLTDIDGRIKNIEALASSSSVPFEEVEKKISAFGDTETLRTASIEVSVFQEELKERQKWAAEMSEVEIEKPLPKKVLEVKTCLQKSGVKSPLKTQETENPSTLFAKALARVEDDMQQLMMLHSKMMDLPKKIKPRWI